ncbi:MAG TPA: AMP-binding protein [Vicinamibacterales bacterium]|nr:AMP-binding protein [Vicinamibacterales bacterium]
MPDLLAPGPGFDAAAARQIVWDDRTTLVLANPAWLKRQPDAAGAASRLLPDLEGHLWVATSGTSRHAGGGVRWVALSRRAILASAAAVNRHLAATPADVWAHALPLFHVGGLGILARAHLSGASVHAAGSGAWDAVSFHGRLAEIGATLTALVPSQVHDLVTAGLRPPSGLRAVVVGGARLDPALYAAARELGWPCLPSYGLTEAASQVATAPLASLASHAYPSVLPLLSHLRAREDEDGILAVRGDSLLTCYAEVENDLVRTWDPRGEGGWFRTGDFGRVHGGGLEVRGRGSDAAKVLGELVSLPGVEARAARWASQEPALAGLAIDLAVAALPHPRLGHELVLALATGDWPSEPDLDARALADSLNRFDAAATLPFERVQRVAIVPAIPRTALGKCQRPLLAAVLLGRANPPGAS